MRKGLVLGLIMTGVLFVGSAFAEDFAFANRSREGTFNMGGAIGFIIDPDTFLMAFEGDYFVHRHFALGPLLQMGLDDDFFLLGATCNFKGVFDLPTSDNFGRRVKPFVQGGAGLAYIDPDFGDDDASFLINFGFGVDIFLTTNFSLGNNMMFNITPTWDDNFFFAWQFITARYLF